MITRVIEEETKCWSSELLTDEKSLERTKILGETIV